MPYGYMYATHANVKWLGYPNKKVKHERSAWQLYVTIAIATYAICMPPKC